MPKQRFSAEQIVTVLRQIEVLMAQGKATPGGLPGSWDIAAESYVMSCSTAKSSTA